MSPRSPIRLTVEQCRVMARAMKKVDFTLFVTLLLCGSSARTWTWATALAQVLNLPSVIYQELRALAAARGMALVEFNFARFSNAHWVQGADMDSPIFKASTKPTSGPLTTQEVTRRMKRYARLVGLDQRAVNLRTVLNTHRWLIKSYGSTDEAAEVIAPMVRSLMDRSTNEALIVPWVPRSQDPRLHGIGRRTRRISALG